MWRIADVKVKASALVTNYDTTITKFGSLSITKVRVRLQTTENVGLDCDPDCTGTC